MYLTHLKAAITEALGQTLQSVDNTDFRGTHVSIEYPLEQAHYPGIWVTYDDRDALEIVGIDHHEFISDDEGNVHDATRWKFAGTVTLTAVALSSRERDALYDEMVRIYAFSRVEGDATVFRTIIENNDFVAVVVNWDQLRPGGDAAGPGTPWGTDEVIYEKSLSFDVEGEFLSDTSTGAMVLLSLISVEGRQVNAAGDPTGAPTLILGVDASTRPFDSTEWH